MPRPICVKCRVVYLCVENDCLVNDVEASGFPSTYWFGDRYECPVCGSGIVVGFGREMSIQRINEIGFRAGGSMTFARETEQLEKFADQFRSEAGRA